MHHSDPFRPPTTAAARFVLGGRFGGEPEEVSFEKLDRFAALGGRLVETSYSYARGRAKEVVGSWLARQAHGLGVVSKVGHDLRGADIPLERDTVRRHVDETLESMHIERLAVLMYHCDDPTREVGELADTLLELRAEGKADRVGVSNWTADRLAPLAEILTDAGESPVVSYHLSLAAPDADALAPLGLAVGSDIADVIGRHGLTLLAWSAQAGGFFARTGPRSAADPFDTTASRARRERSAELAAQLGTRPEVVALAWALGEPGVWPTIGPTSPAQLEGSLDAARIALTPDQREWLVTGITQEVQR